jgi:hypothetical protein
MEIPVLPNTHIKKPKKRIPLSDSNFDVDGLQHSSKLA